MIYMADFMLFLLVIFFQLKPVQGKPLYKGNTIQFSAINKAVFLHILLRFDQDLGFGETMRRFKIGKVTN